MTDTYKKVAFSFAIPTIYFLGALYSVSFLSACILFTPPSPFPSYPRFSKALSSSHPSYGLELTPFPQSVSSRFIFFRVFRNSEHRHSNTLVGWGSWVAIVAVSWVIAFLIAEVIPFFSDMLSLMCSLFDGWFG